MSAPTAASILRQLEARRTQAQVAALADMDDSAQDEVRRLLGQVKPSARVDIGKLVESVRRSTARRMSGFTPQDREAARAANAAWRSACAARSVSIPSPEAYAVMLGMQATAYDDVDDLDLDDELPDDLDDDDAKPLRRRRRKSVPRRASRRAAVSPAAGPDRADPAPGREQRVLTRPAGVPARSYLGPKLISAADFDYDPGYDPMPPPWLLDDELPDEDDGDRHELDETRVGA